MIGGGAGTMANKSVPTIGIGFIPVDGRAS